MKDLTRTSSNPLAVKIRMARVQFDQVLPVQEAAAVSWVDLLLAPAAPWAASAAILLVQAA